MKKHLQNQLDRINAARAAFVTSLMVAAGSASAALPEAVSTELGGLKDNVDTIAGLTFAVFLVIVAYKYFRRSAS